MSQNLSRRSFLSLLPKVAAVLAVPLPTINSLVVREPAPVVEAESEFIGYFKTVELGTAEPTWTMTTSTYPVDPDTNAGLSHGWTMPNGTRVIYWSEE